MAYTRGRCTNVDYCSVAESRREVQVPVGQDFVCPECGKPLKTPDVAAKKSFVVPAVIGAGVLAVLGGAVFLGMRMGGGAPAPARLAAIPAPAPVPAPAAVSPPAPIHPAPPTDTVLARLTASTALGDNFAARLAAAYLANIGDTGVAIAASGHDLRVSGQRGDRTEVIIISPGASDGAFAALAQGQTNGVITAQRISPAQKQATASLGDMSSPSAEHMLATDEAAVITNGASRLEKLTGEQARAIFAGRITDWANLGQAPGTIDVISADASAAALGDGAVPVGRRLADPAAVAAAVTADPRAIGLVPPSSAGAARMVALAETGATPVLPTDLGAVLRGDYPLAARLYLYTSPASADGFAGRIANYGLSPAGQAILQQAGFIPATARAQAEAPAAPATTSDRLRAFVSGAKRLAIDFHFQPNSTNLDDKSQRDLDRVLNYIVSNHYTGANVELAGFADNQGDAASNIAVSKKRADAVAALFARRGLAPAKVAGFGGELPIADNSTEAGRERNRRVEVYLRP